MMYEASTLLWSTVDVIVFYNAGVDERRAGGEPYPEEPRSGEHLRHAEGDGGVLAALVGVQALAVVPEQVPAGPAVIGESREQVEGLPAARPQGQVGRLDSSGPGLKERWGKEGGGRGRGRGSPALV